MSNLKWGRQDPKNNAQGPKSNTLDNFSYIPVNTANSCSEPPNQKNLINDLRSELTNLKSQFMKLTTKPNGPPTNGYSDQLALGHKKVEEKTPYQFQTLYRKKSNHDTYRPQLGHSYTTQGNNGDPSKSHSLVKNQYIKPQNNVATPSEIYQLNAESKFRRMPSGQTMQPKNKHKQYQINTPNLIKNQGMNQEISTNHMNSFSDSSTPTSQNSKAKQESEQHILENHIIQQKLSLLEARLSQEMSGKKQQLKQIQELAHQNILLTEQNQKITNQFSSIYKELQQERKNHQISKNQAEKLRHQHNFASNDKTQLLTRIKDLEQTVKNIEAVNKKLNINEDKIAKQKAQVLTENQKIRIKYQENQRILRNKQRLMIDRENQIDSLKKNIKEFEEINAINRAKESQENKETEIIQQIRKQNKMLSIQKAENLHRTAQLQKEVERLSKNSSEKQLKQLRNQCAQMTKVINEKQIISRNMLRDMKVFEKQLHDLRKIRKLYEQINLKNNEQIVSQHISLLNNKYSAIEDLEYNN